MSYTLGRNVRACPWESALSDFVPDTRVCHLAACCSQLRDTASSRVASSAIVSGTAEPLGRKLASCNLAVQKMLHDRKHGSEINTGDVWTLDRLDQLLSSRANPRLSGSLFERLC